MFGARSRRGVDRLHARGGGGVRPHRPGDVWSRRTASRTCSRPSGGASSRRTSSASSSRPKSRCAPAAARRSPRRPRSSSSAARSSPTLGARRRRPLRSRRIRGALAGAAHHRHAALPSQRRAPALRRLAQQHVGLHVHVGINGADRAVRRDALRNYLPELLALSASSPFVEGVFTHLHSARTSSSRACSRAAGSRTRSPAGRSGRSYVRFLYETGSVTEHTQIWWSVRAAPRVPDGRDPDCDAQPELGESVARGLCTRSTARIAARIDKGEPLPDRRTACWRRTSGARSAGGSPAS